MLRNRLTNFVGMMRQSSIAIDGLRNGLIPNNNMPC